MIQTNVQNFTHIVIGAGSAGCVLANRIVKTGKFKVGRSVLGGCQSP